MKGYVNLTHTNNSAIEEVSQKVDEIQDDYVTKDTTELTNYYTKSQTYTKEEVDNKTTNVYRAKGSVQTYQDLPTEGNQVGDVYNVIEAYQDYPAGTNFVWTDTSTWDALGGEISVIQGVSQEDFDNLVNNVTQIEGDKNSIKLGGASATNAGESCVVIGKNASVSGNYGVAIGRNSKSGGTGTAIGTYAIANNSGSIAIGSESYTSFNSEANANYAIQIGRGTNSTQHSFQIETDNIYKADTHTLTVQNAEINGTPAYGVLSGTSAPTTTTVGAVGQFYLDTTNKKLYQCMSITTETVDEVDTNVYEWTNLSESGVSQTDFDNLVNNITQIQARDDNSFKIGGASVANSSTVAIGKNADGGANLSVVIGRNTEVSGSQQVAIGYKAKTGFNAGSIAIGSNAQLGHSVSGIQLGSGTNNTTQTLQIHNDNIYNYNTHTLTVNNIEQNGNPVYAVLQGTTAPDTTTVGAVTQFYLNTTDKKLYQCVAINIEDLTYEWKQIGGGSSGGTKYQHNIELIASAGLEETISFSIITDDNLPYKSGAEVYQALANICIQEKPIIATGISKINDDTSIIINIFVSNAIPTEIKFKAYDLTTGILSIQAGAVTSYFVNDIVVEL